MGSAGNCGVNQEQQLDTGGPKKDDWSEHDGKPQGLTVCLLTDFAIESKPTLELLHEAAFQLLQRCRVPPRRARHASKSAWETPGSAQLTNAVAKPFS